MRARGSSSRSFARGREGAACRRTNPRARPRVRRGRRQKRPRSRNRVSHTLQWGAWSPEPRESTRPRARAAGKGVAWSGESTCESGPTRPVPGVTGGTRSQELERAHAIQTSVRRARRTYRVQPRHQRADKLLRVGHARRLRGRRGFLQLWFFNLNLLLGLTLTEGLN